MPRMLTTYLENWGDPPHVNDTGSEVLSDGGEEQHEGDPEEEGEEEELDEEDGAELDGEDGEPGHGEHPDGGGEGGKQEAEVVRPPPDLAVDGLLLGQGRRRWLPVSAGGSGRTAVAGSLLSSAAVAGGGRGHVGSEQVALYSPTSSVSSA